EDLLNEDTTRGKFGLPFSPENEQRVLEQFGGAATNPMCQVNRAQLANVLHSVRNGLLLWALDLEKDGVRGENFEFTPREKEIAGIAAQSVTIYQAAVTNTNIQSSGS